jgi:hypothetical protein
MMILFSLKRGVTGTHRSKTSNSEVLSSLWHSVSQEHVLCPQLVACILRCTALLLSLVAYGRLLPLLYSYTVVKAVLVSP